MAANMHTTPALIVALQLLARALNHGLRTEKQTEQTWLRSAQFRDSTSTAYFSKFQVYHTNYPEHPNTLQNDFESY